MVFRLIMNGLNFVNFKSPRFTGTGNGLPWIYYLMFDLVYPLYTFNLDRKHVGEANVAFLDRHVESLTLRELTLPVKSTHRRWHYDGKAHLDRLCYRDVDNWGDSSWH